MQQEYPVTLTHINAGGNHLRLSKEKRLIHLLKRAFIGVSFQEYLELEEKSLSEIIHTFINVPLITTFPLKDYSSVNERNPDHRVKFGEPWVTDINFDASINIKRKQSLRKWLAGILYADQQSIRPAMILFWNHHFPIQMQRVSLAGKAYDYFSTIINFSLENYKDLVLHSITSFTMLEFHKKINTQAIPLFKFHSHQLLCNIFGPDYAGYLSKDRIKRFTRLLSEWNRLNDVLVLSASKSFSEAPETNYIQHNALSLPENLKHKPAVTELLNELDDTINKLLQFEEAAYNLSEKLFRWFIYFDSSKKTSKRIIKKIASSAMENKYDIKKTLLSLFLHEDIYTTQYYGSLIKSPVAFVFGLCKELNCIDTKPVNTIEHYQQWEWLLKHTESLGQCIGDPVIEYEKQQSWITSKTIQQREQLITRLLDTENLYENSSIKSDLDPVIRFANNSPSLDSLLDFLVLHFTHTQYYLDKKNSLRRFAELNYGITDKSWSKMMEQLQQHPQNTEVKKQVSGFLKKLLEHFLAAPEYHFY